MIVYNYFELKEKYENDMNKILRDFNNTDKYIRLWVPDESHSKSILNLIISVVECGGKNIKIIYDCKKSKKKIDMKEIINGTKNYGEISNIKENDILSIFFKKINKINKNYIAPTILKKRIKKKNIFHSKSKIDKIDFDEIYLSNIKKFKIKKNTNKILSSSKEINVEYNNISMNLFIDPKFYKIIKCNIDYDGDERIKYFYDLFCFKITNTPIYEARDHGLIYLENMIRPKEINDKIKGIIVPIFLSKMFISAQKLMDLVYNKSEKIFKNLPKINEFDYAVNKDWKKLKIDKQKKLLNNYINEYEKKNNIKKGSIQIKKIEFNTKITVTILDKFIDLQKNLINLEIFIREKIDKRLELFYSEMIDENKLRIKNSPQKL